MDITTNITVPDFVYLFYCKLAKQIGNTTPERVMADALLTYAGSAAAAVIDQGVTDHCENTKL